MIKAMKIYYNLHLLFTKVEVNSGGYLSLFTDIKVNNNNYCFSTYHTR